MTAEHLGTVPEGAILCACPIPVVVVNTDLRIVYANESARNLFFHHREEDSCSLLAMIPGLRDLDCASFGSPDGIWLLHGAARDGLQVMARSQDETFPVELGVRSIHNGSEELTVVVIHDMRGLNSSLAAIMRAHRELAEFNRVAIGREIRMVALKEEVNALLEQLGQPPRYPEED